MENETTGSRIQLHSKSPIPQESQGGISYLKSLAGIIRVLNVLLGVLSLILVLLGFPDDYSYSEQDDRVVLIPDRYERKRRPWLRLTGDGRYSSFENYYGAGYSNEHVNVVQLVCIVICLVLSVFSLFFLVISPVCHFSSKPRGCNRFLNLSMAIIQFAGFLSGIFGLLLFRSYCCHVEFSGEERHKSELEGYFREPCLCYITPARTFDSSQRVVNYQYKTLYFHDTPDDIIFHSALPHHFIPHAIALCFTGMDTALHLFATFRI